MNDPARNSKNPTELHAKKKKSLDFLTERRADFPAVLRLKNLCRRIY